MSALKRKKCWGSSPKMKITSNENRFNLLQNLDEDNDTYSEGDQDRIKEYKIVIPPIIVDQCHGFIEVFKLIGKDFEFKRMSIGTKIISSSMTNYDTAKKKLTAANFKYYTHECKDTKMFKLFLYGLPKLNLNEIEEELKIEYNVIAHNIKEIQTARSSADDALYVLEFDRTLSSKTQIMKIRRLCNIVIYWRNPLKSKKGPTQCTKCAMYGHGSKNCFRNNICIACGGEHDFSVCQINKTSESASFRCFNCVKKNLRNIHHRADDPRCPSRKEYLIMRDNINKKNHPQQNHFFRELFDEVPNVSQNAEFSNTVPNENSQTFPARSYAEAVRLPRRTLNSKGNIFSIDELFEIFSRAVSDLQKCTSKMEQLTIIMQMLKYAV